MKITIHNASKEQITNRYFCFFKAIFLITKNIIIFAITKKPKQGNEPRNQTNASPGPPTLSPYTGHIIEAK